MNIVGDLKPTKSTYKDNSKQVRSIIKRGDVILENAKDFSIIIKTKPERVDRNGFISSNDAVFG